MTPQETAGPQEPADPYSSPPPGGWPGPAPAAPWGPPAQSQHPRGTVILILGILSVTFMALLGPVAWVMGHSTLHEIDRSGHAYSNRSTVVVGMVLGIIGTALVIMGILVLLVLFAVAIAA